METSILVVDDDPLNRQVVARRLSREGYFAVTAESGQEAIELLGRQRFDLLLMDLDMPGMDGIATLKKIRADSRWSGIPVIMLTGNNNPESRRKCLSAGAADYLIKPLVMPLVHARIAACLHAGKEPIEEMAQPVADGARVLIVDDDELGSRLLGRQLEGRGYSVAIANSGDTALQWLKDGQTDVVLLDINMPGMSGTDTLKQIRANDRTRTLPVIMVTASNDVANMLECVDHGADGYITKPIDFSWLNNCIVSSLKVRRDGVMTDLP
jgi:putative two-component system response regulator